MSIALHHFSDVAEMLAMQAIRVAFVSASKRFAGSKRQ
jgi:tRNA isopentenyl-2-thiomethyl-A-37 hydroxylase MiaE